MKKLITLVLLPFLFVSCGEDFTALSPISQRNSENYYSSQKDFEIAITGAYSSLQESGTFGVNYVLLMEMRADNGANGGGATGLAAVYQQLDDFDEIPTAEILEDTWAASYDGIASCNAILSRIDGVDFTSETLKDQIRGEALFIRSLLYYHMAVIFGNIPAQFEEADYPNIDINQVSAADIYAQVVDDLEEAESLLPPASVNGRANKYAAAALLGRVHLQAGNASAAEAPLRRVMNDQVYDLEDDFSRLWDPNTQLDQNSESIFEVQFISGGLGEGSAYTDMYTPNGVGGGVGGGVAPQNVTDDIVAAYDSANDGRFWTTFDTVGLGPDNFWVKKFDSNPSRVFDAPNNWVEIRYAEVLLNLAEALGESDEAYDLINEVRDRAGLGDIDENTPGTFEEKLLNERRLEFAFENKRWADLLRFGQAKPVMSGHLGISESEVTLLYPIPQSAIDVTPDEMTQNSEHQ
ncbi:RagB/SusD family nutrient uptake outer membrane protein [Gracilimonas tropica]|uniref:RagB/SusD family nutrient uptake outer membrane protein n=1 Tax=Gracilimonas tropica TaxID=454600 RepID=UPI0003AA5146|nr:RagB/SusD family nutrient uptake outer membrane protein [Gracilimonas tropica]